MLVERKLRKGINLSLTSGVFWSVFFAATTGPVLAGLLVSLDMSNVLIGLVNSMMMLCLPFQVIGVVLQQRFFSRKRFWFIVTLCYYLSYIGLVLLLISWSGIPKGWAILAFVCVFAVAQISAQLGASLWFAWMGELIPPRESNTFWNRRTGLTQLGLLTTSLCVGFIIDSLGRECPTTYAWVWAGGVVFGFFSLWTQSIVEDTAGDKSLKRLPLLSRLILTWRNERFRKLILFFGIQSLFVWLLVPFIFIYLQKNLGFDMMTVQILVGIGGVVSFFSGYVFRVVGGKYGRKPIVLLCAFLKGVEFIVWGLLIPGSHWMVAIPVFVLGGFVNMGLVSSQLSLLTSVERRKNQSFSIGVFFAVNGLIGFTSSCFSGVVYDWLEHADWFLGESFSPFNIMAFVVALGYFASLLVFVKFREKGAGSAVEVVRVLLSNNPFRSVYHAHILARPMREHNRVAALQNAKGNLIATELINDLYSPSSRVRESAVWNIARLEEKASPVLEDELLKLLDAPEFGVQASVARALGHIKSHKSVPLLEKHLDVGELALTQACVFALGMIGDDRSTRKLRSLLDHERYRVVWPQAAEALGKLGDWRHTRKLFAAYATEFNWVLRKQFLIAIVRTMMPTKRRDVFPAFENEDKTPGVFVDKLIKTVQSRLATKNLSLKYRRLLEVATDDMDAGDYSGAMEKMLLMSINTLCPSIFSEELTTNNIQSKLNSVFGSTGKIKHHLLLEETCLSVGIGLLCHFWADVKYRPDEFNRYVFLAFLLVLCEMFDR